jgi:predicted dehydrogenase
MSLDKKLARRKFLKEAGAAALGISLFPNVIKATALGKGDNIAPNDKITMALVGCGGMGRDNLNEFLKFDDVQAVAVCDVDDKQAAAAKKMIDEKYGNNDCRVYKDFREMLEKETLDTAILALPDHWHALISVAFANKGIDIYGGKPLARSIAGGRAIVDAVNRNNIVWQMGSWQRSVSHFRQAAELVRNGRIGKVDFVEVGLPDGGHYIGNPPAMEIPEGVDWDMWLGPAPEVPFRGVLHFNWRWIQDYSGGQLTDWAGHHIDIAHWGLGFDHSGPVSIKGEGRPNNDGIYNVFAEYDFNCKYAEGVEIRVANQSKLNHGMGTLWKGTDGWIHVSRSGINASDKNILNEKIGSNEISLYKSNNHQRNFIDCVKSRKKTITPAEVGHRSISVGLLGEIAMITGQELQWDPVKERFADNNVYASRLLERPCRLPWESPA